jgi:hypothetical protein
MAVPRADSKHATERHNALKLNNAWWRCTRAGKLKYPNMGDTYETGEGCVRVGERIVS